MKITTSVTNFFCFFSAELLFTYCIVALDVNDIPYAALHGANSANLSKFKRNLQKFKNREDVKVRY